jgi:putative adenylate-forming enzyme
MKLSMLLLVLYRKWLLTQRSRWSRSKLLRVQQVELAALRQHAYQHSSFYRETHAGLYDAPLEVLPVMSKQTLMNHFEAVVTDPAVRLRDALDHVAGMVGDALFMGRYRAVTTSGTTGLRGLFFYDTSEWEWILASYMRAFEWGGAGISLMRKQKVALVSSLAPWHQSTRVGLTANSPFVKTLRIDARQSFESVIESLNEFQPEFLVGYADMVRLVAEAQGKGKLKITPRAIYCSSEPLTPQARSTIQSVWRVNPFNVYAATETAGIASECELHQGLHLYEDLVIPEVLDDRYRPVPIGELGSRLVVTVLFSRTLPLIRYELSDSVAISPDPCPCGRPFAILKDVEGRQEDLLWLPDSHGHPVTIHPNLFHGVMEGLPVKQWQIVQEPGRLRVLIQTESDVQVASILRARMEMALKEAVGNVPEIEIEQVQEIQKTTVGKRKLIVGRSQPAACA